jgi:hypothetical protein
MKTTTQRKALDLKKHKSESSSDEIYYHYSRSPQDVPVSWLENG